MGKYLWESIYGMENDLNVRPIAGENEYGYDDYVWNMMYAT